MDKHAKRSSPLHYPVLIVFTLFFVGLFALDLITPDRAYSEMENTTLSQRPALTQLSAKGLNSYFTAYTKYVKDQVFGRDQWISLQSMVETTLLQKEQNGGILLGREHMMFPRTFGLLSSEERTLPKNTSAVESLCQRYPGKVNVLLAPAASDIYPENVPVNAPLLDENTYLDQLSAAVQAAGGRFVDVRGTLTDHKGEYLYYRTDHHWTSLAARYAFETLSAQLDLQPVRSYTVYPVSDSFEGTLAAKTGSHAALDTIEIYVPDTDVQYAVTYADTQTTICSLYDRAKLAEKNQYEVFFGGNHARVDIQTTADTGRTLLLLKDSYANCFVQFLTPYYDRILMIDPRYFYDDLGALLRRERVTDALILYNYNTFVQDHALSVVLQSALFDEGE